MAVGSRAIKAGEAFVSMILDDKAFADSIDDWQTKLRGIGRRLRPLGQTLAGLSGVISAPFILGTRNLITFTKELDLAAARLGVAGEEFARLSAFSTMTGVSLEALEIGMKTIGERIVQLQAGSNETAQAFQQLGISADEFLGAGSNMERLLMISEAMSKISDAGLQSGLALRTLGEAGNRLLPILRLGREALEEIMENLGDFAPDESQLAAARQLNIAWVKLRLAASNLTGELAEKLVPVMVPLLEATTDMVVWVKQWTDEHPNLTRAIGLTSIALGGLATAMLSVGAVTTVATTALQGFQVALTAGIIPALGWLQNAFLAVEMHISGVGVALTPLATGLLAVGSIAAGVLVPLKLLTGMTWTQTFLAGWQIVNERLFTMISMLDILPDKLQAIARVAAEMGRWLIFGDEMEAPQQADTGPGAAALNAGLGRGGTSGIAAAFASQQTLGFSATNPQLQSLQNIEGLMGHGNALQESLLEEVRKAGLTN